MEFRQEMGDPLMTLSLGDYIECNVVTSVQNHVQNVVLYSVADNIYSGVSD